MQRGTTVAPRSQGQFGPCFRPGACQFIAHDSPLHWLPGTANRERALPCNRS
jgi:hypothetical protein